MGKTEKQIKISYLIEQLDELTNGPVTIIYWDNDGEFHINTASNDVNELKEIIEFTLVQINKQIK